MEQSTLKYLRILIPGVIFLLAFFPIYDKHFSDIYKVDSLDFSYLTFFSLIAGSIYYQLDLQHIITKHSHNIITNNIKNQLISISGLTLSNPEKQKIEHKKRYMHVFYNLVDKDESLKRKAANVYFNGIFWTSTADSFLISLLFFLLYKFVVIDVQHASEFSFMFLILAIMSFVLHILTVI